MFTPPNLGKKSPETIELRQKVLDGCEQLIWEFFNAGGQCVIYDANNGRREQRQRVAAKFGKEGIHVVILGSHTTAFGFIALLFLDISPCRIDL